MRGRIDHVRLTKGHARYKLRGWRWLLFKIQGYWIKLKSSVRCIGE
jgi:hypothetical protein